MRIQKKTHLVCNIVLYQHVFCYKLISHVPIQYYRFPVVTSLHICLIQFCLFGYLLLDSLSVISLFGYLLIWLICYLIICFFLNIQFIFLKNCWFLIRNLPPLIRNSPPLIWIWPPPYSLILLNYSSRFIWGFEPFQNALSTCSLWTQILPITVNIP